MNKISVIVLTHNDELRIIDCLECLAFANEIIVVDDNSSDRTVELARQYTSNVFVHEMNGNFSNQRNFALNLVHYDWVLFVDSDELVSEKLRIEIKSSVNSSKSHGYYIRRIDYMWGKKILHGEVGQTKFLRLARNGYGKWRGKVHEEWNISGNISELAAPLVHVPHQSVKEFVADIDHYSTLRANELHEQGKKVRAISIFMYPVGKFLYNYFIKKGYKDRVPGLIYAILMSFHSFLVRGKLYLKSMPANVLKS